MSDIMFARQAAILDDGYGHYIDLDYPNNETRINILIGDNVQEYDEYNTFLDHQEYMLEYGQSPYHMDNNNIVPVHDPNYSLLMNPIIYIITCISKWMKPTL